MADLRTPLYDWHTARKARIVPFGGWALPVQYTSVLDEHQAVRTGCGLFDVSHMGRLSFGGAGAFDLIQKVWTNDASKLKDFQVRYGLICNANGGTRDDVLVYRWPYGWAMVVNASNRAKIVAHLQEHADGLDVSIDDQTETTAMLAVQGPLAVPQSAGLFEAEVSALKYYTAAPTRWQGQNCVISRTGYTGEDGYEVMLKAEYAVELADEIERRGAKPCGLGARDTLRLEAAMPLYGHELTEEISPLAAGMGWAVKFEKGDFIGKGPLLLAQETRSEPVRVGLVLDGRRPAREGSAVLLGDGRNVGRVTSGSPSPTLGKPLALAFVEPAHAGVGTRLLVDIRGETAAAEVVPLPFYKRSK